jgi:membrane protein implicated in regulation of membrane protease activity
VSDEGNGHAPVLLAFTRLWLPLIIAVIGAVAIVLGHARTPLAGAGVVLLGTAVIVWMVNWMFRMSVQSNRDRETEERAREYFDRHGRWPDEDDQ